MGSKEKVAVQPAVALIVRQPFMEYKKGERIEDPRAVTAALADYSAYVTKVAK